MRPHGPSQVCLPRPPTVLVRVSPLLLVDVAGLAPVHDESAGVEEEDALPGLLHRDAALLLQLVRWPHERHQEAACRLSSAKPTTHTLSSCIFEQLYERLYEQLYGWAVWPACCLTMTYVHLSLIHI